VVYDLGFGVLSFGRHPTSDCPAMLPAPPNKLLLLRRRGLRLPLGHRRKRRRGCTSTDCCSSLCFGALESRAYGNDMRHRNNFNIICEEIKMSLTRPGSPACLSNHIQITFKFQMAFKYLSLSLSLSLYTYISIYVYIYVYICIYMYIYIYTHTYISIHTYIHTRVYRNNLQPLPHTHVKTVGPRAVFRVRQRQVLVSIQDRKGTFSP
jgi:hypothetical protein